jgi:hypothetical protein
MCCFGFLLFCLFDCMLLSGNRDGAARLVSARAEDVDAIAQNAV